MFLVVEQLSNDCQKLHNYVTATAVLRNNGSKGSQQYVFQSTTSKVKINLTLNTLLFPGLEQLQVINARNSDWFIHCFLLT